MSELRERIALAMFGARALGKPGQRGYLQAFYEDAEYVWYPQADAVIAVLGDVEEHVEWRVVDREGEPLPGDQRQPPWTRPPSTAYADRTGVDRAPHHVEQRTVTTFTGSWERSPDTAASTS